MAPMWTTGGGRGATGRRISVYCNSTVTEITQENGSCAR